MKRLRLLLLIGLLPSFGWGQVWNKTYPASPILSPYPFPVYQNNTQYNTGVGYSNVYTWDYRYGGLLSNGITGPGPKPLYSHYLMRLNPLGDTVWTRLSSFGNAYTRAVPISMGRLSNGDYIITAQCGDTLLPFLLDYRIVRMDSSGNVLLNKLLLRSKNNIDYRAIPAESGGYYIAGTFTYKVSDSSSHATWTSMVTAVSFEKYDSADVLVAADSFKDEEIHLYADSAAGCAYPGGLYNLYTKILDLQPAADGGLLCLIRRDTLWRFSPASCSKYRSPGARQGGGYVCRYDKNLQVMWTTDLQSAMNIPPGQHTEPGHLIPTSDSGMAVTANVRDTFIAGVPQAIGQDLIIRLDKNGNLRDSARFPAASLFTRGRGTETTDKHLLFVNRLDCAIFMDEHLGVLSYTPLPRLSSFGFSSWTPLSANASGGAFIPYIRDSASGIYSPGNYFFPCSISFDSLCSVYPASVSGRLVRDKNINCSYEPATDNVLRNKPVVFTNTATGKAYVSYSNSNGNYVSSVPPGTYDATHSPNVNSAIECPVGGYPGITLSTPGLISGYNFYDTVASSRRDMSILVSSGRFVRGFNSLMQIFAFNDGGSNTVSDTVRMVRPPSINYISASPSPTISTGDTLIWVLSNIALDSVVTINVNLMTPLSASLGASLTFPVSVSCPLDAAPANNTDTLFSDVVGPYDPNCKSINRPLHTTARKDWVYTIEFQNTGNYPAKDVVVADVLDTKLDLSSLRILSSTHGMPRLVWQEGGQLLFRFDNINLPDSVNNEPGSHGSFSFIINPKKGIKPGDTITNTANIFFDFNTAVQTNTTMNIVVDAPVTLSVPGQQSGPRLTVYPNPNSGRFTVEGTSKGTILIYDMQGRPQATFPMNRGNTTVELSPILAPGIYVLQARSDDGGLVGIARIVLQ